MPQDLDLKSALEMFQQGTRDLLFQRSLNQANEAVQQIKSTETNEQKQRAQMQQVSNGLVMQMANLGIPATTMQMISQAVQGPHMGNANEMAAQANLTGDSQLMDSAQHQQAFEQNPEYKKELIKAKGLQAALSGQGKESDKTDKAFTDFSNKMNSALASSRSAYGQWAQVGGRGERLDAVLGDPSSWKHMNAEQLELVKDGLVQMSKGGVMTEADHKALSPMLAKVYLAQKESMATGQPVQLDLSGYAGMYSGLIKREEGAAAQKLSTIGLNIATGNMRLAKKDPEQFKRTIASQISTNVGKVISPEDIVIDNDRVKLKPGVAAKAPKLSSTLGLDNSPAPDQQVKTGLVNGKIIKYIQLPNGKAQIIE